MMMDEQSIDRQFHQAVYPPIRQVITYGLYVLCIVSIALAGVACTIANDDEDVVETPPTSISLEVLLTSGLNSAQVGALLMEIWIHDLDDAPFDNGMRDSDQVDTAAQLLPRSVVRDRVPADNLMDDRFTFEIGLENNVAAGNNLVFSLLLFPSNESLEPMFVARQGAFTLPEILGQTISLTLGAVELVQFGDTTVSESMDNATFTGTLVPASPRAVVFNLQTQDDTASEVEPAIAGEDYEATDDDEVVRFEPGATEGMFAIPLVNDFSAESTESFNVQIALDLQFPNNNRAFIIGGLNGGTFTQVTGTITDEDSAMLPPPPATGIRLEALLPLEGDLAQVSALPLEVWAHDLDDSPFDITARDSDQVDTATRLLDRTTVQDLQLSNEITDRLLFDLDLANGVTAGNNLVFSVLIFPDNDSLLPTLIARQGNFDLPDAFGDTIAMALVAAEIVAFDNAMVEESTSNAIFLGSIIPSSPRAVVLAATRDGTSAEFDAAREGEDYTATTSAVRFEAGAVEETIIVPIIDDDFAEPTEAFDVLLALDIRSATNNRAYLDAGLNGGTFAEFTGTITDEDAPTMMPPPETGIRLAVTLPPELSVAQAGDQLVEICIHDLNDSPFTNGARDRDQIDIALRLQDRIAVRDFVLNGDVADPLTFDIDLENELSIGDNLVISVLIFATAMDTTPTFVARQGPFDLDALLGQTVSLILGTAEIVQFSDTTVKENVGNASFAGTLAPASNRAVEISFRTQNGTTPQVGSARAGEDYDFVSSVVRFDPGETQETIIVPIIDDEDMEPTESFDVQLELDIRFPANNRAFIASGLNGGTFGQLTGTLTDND